jgi:hypothetical protein
MVEAGERLLFWNLITEQDCVLRYRVELSAMTSEAAHIGQGVGDVLHHYILGLRLQDGVRNSGVGLNPSLFIYIGLIRHNLLMPPLGR